jgi:hypothetical protein
MQWLVDERYPAAKRIRVVLDQFNTHGPAALYEAFAPAEARRSVEKLEFHHTPKHGPIDLFQRQHRKGLGQAFCGVSLAKGIDKGIKGYAGARDPIAAFTVFYIQRRSHGVLPLVMPLCGRSPRGGHLLQQL